MKEKVKIIFFFPLMIPHIICYLISKKKRIIDSDIVRWGYVRKSVDKNNCLKSLIILLVEQKDFRTQFYFRIGTIRNLLQVFLKPIANISFEGCEIGPGFILMHGFGVVLNGAAKIGSNCMMLHNVTIGTVHGDDFPVIGNNVYIGAGAIILGDVHIGNNVKIGAGAIVVDDVPDDSTVVGEKAHVVIQK